MIDAYLVIYKFFKGAKDTKKGTSKAAARWQYRPDFDKTTKASHNNKGLLVTVMFNE